MTLWTGNVTDSRWTSGINVDMGLILDEVTGAVAAYSLQKIKNSYTGDCVLLRRSSDDEELAFGFQDDLIDTASISTWLGVATGYVKTWYDQSGGGHNVTQTNTARQPVLDVSGSIPFIDFTGNTVSLNVADHNDLDFPADFSFFVEHSSPTDGADPAYSGIISKGFTTSFPAKAWGYTKLSSDVDKFRFSSSDAAGGGIQILVDTPVLSSGFSRITGLRSGSTASLYVDNALAGSDTSATVDLTNTSEFRIGANQAGQSINASIKNVILWGKALNDSERGEVDGFFLIDANLIGGDSSNLVGGDGSNLSGGNA